MRLYQHNNLNQKKYDMPQYFYTKIYNKLFKDAGHKVELIDCLNFNFNKDDTLLVDSFVFMRNFNFLKDKCKLIVISMEPIFLDKWKGLFDMLSTSELVIEYSMRNINLLKENNVKTILCPPGYSPIYKDIYSINTYPSTKKTIDVLFYGTYNKRRSHIFEQLSKKCKVMIKNSGNLKNQNFLINKAKIVLIVHQDDTKNFDFARASFLISNKVMVIHEMICDEENINDVKNNIMFENYDNLVETTLKVLKDDNISKLADKQYKFYESKMNMEQYIPSIKNIN